MNMLIGITGLRMIGAVISVAEHSRAEFFAGFPNRRIRGLSVLRSAMNLIRQSAGHAEAADDHIRTLDPDPSGSGRISNHADPSALPPP